MVTFHQQSQKFAVGTGDGLIVIYDLRTATKWRILEGNAGAIAALSFSPDGNRLASYCAADRSVRTWRCGSEGFLGGLLMGASSGKCATQHMLPPLAAPSAGGDQAAAPWWRAVSITWAELQRGTGEKLRLVREDAGAPIFLGCD